MTTDDSQPAKDATTTPGPGKAGRRRWIRRAAVAAAMILMIAGGGLWIVTRSWFIISQVQPELERRLGGSVSVRHASYLGSGQFLFSDVLLRSNNLSGPAGEILHIDRIEVATDTGSWSSGSPTITGVRIEGVRFRLSEDRSIPGAFNFMSLTPRWPETDLDDATTLPPQVQVYDAVVEMCQHDSLDAAYFDVIGERRFAGELRPGNGSVFHFMLAEADEHGNQLGPEGMIVRGDWNVQTNAYSSRLDGLRLDARTLRMCPEPVRAWWERMDLQGAVSSATIAWAPDTTPEMRLNVEQVALTLPIDSEGFWARYRDGAISEAPSRPRLNVESGTIVLRPDAAQLVDLRGQLVSGDGDDNPNLVELPYRIDMSVTLPDNPGAVAGASWIDQVWTHAAFDLNFRLEPFSVGATVDENDDVVMPAVDLPAVVADALRRFEMRRWLLETQVRITRAQPELDAEGTYVAQPIVSDGVAIVKHARCAYDRFPYPLSDVSATIEFDNDAVRVVELTGTSSNGQPVTLAGTISPLDGTAGVELRITGTGIALDDVLRDAMPGESQRAFDALLNRDAYARLVEAGTLLGPSDIERLVHERDEIRQRIETLSNDAATAGDDNSAQRLGHLEFEARRLTRLIDAGPFELGGIGDVDLWIRRDVGRYKPTRIEGEMAIRKVGMVYERFAYPMILQGGVLTWGRDAIVVGDGPDNPVEFITPGGGEGRAWGMINLGYNPVRVEPDLHLLVTGEMANKGLYAAIPVVPGRDVQIADVLESLHLDAVLDCGGSIFTGDDGHTQYSFNLAMAEGTAKPDANITELVGMTGLHWPESLTLDDVNATLRVNPQGVTLEHVQAHHQGGTITASGSVGGSKIGTQLAIDFTRMPVDSYLIDLVPSDDVQRLRDLWSRYQPTGNFDAHIAYDDRHGDGVPILRFEPNDITISVEGQQLDIARESGSIDIVRDTVHFSDVTLELSDAQRPDGRITLAGSYGMSATNDHFHVTGDWRGGRFESMAVPEVMHLIDAEELAAEFRSHAIDGRFDAAFSYQSPRDDLDRDFTLELWPYTASMMLEDTRVHARFDPGVVVTVRPGVVAFDAVSGLISDSQFTLEGWLRFDETWREADLALSFDGHLTDPQVQALMPLTVQEAMLAMEMTEAAASHAPHCTIRLWNHMDDPDPAQRYVDAQFNGRVFTRDASIVGGVTFEHIAGGFDISFTRVDEKANATIDVLVDAMDVLGQRITEATTTIELSDDETTMIVSGARGECYGGAVSVDAVIGIGENLQYTFDVDLVGVGLKGMLDAAEAQTSGQAENLGGPQVGQLFGKLSMSGLRKQEPVVARGRGSVRVIDAAMARMPITLRLIQILELMPPLSESFNYADASFYVQGDRLIFEHILLECPTLQLVGDGDMIMETMEVDWILRSRGTLSVIRELVGGLSNTLFGIRVTGPLKDPSAELVPIPAMAQPGSRPVRPVKVDLVEATSTASGRPDEE